MNRKQEFDINESENDTWIVLIGGDNYKRENAKTLGAHTSILPIGKAFEQLRVTFPTFPRDKIIVIAQLEECRRWHNTLSDSEKVTGITDPDRIKAQSKMWAEKKDIFNSTMARLISEGGADYDEKDVNPDTVLNVLMGIKSKKCNRVVEYNNEKTTRVFVAMFSHGDWNGSKDNHFFWLPYPSPPLLSIFNSQPRPPSPVVDVPINTYDGIKGAPQIAVELNSTEIRSCVASTVEKGVAQETNTIAEICNSTGYDIGDINSNSKDCSLWPEEEPLWPFIGQTIDHPIYKCINSYIPWKWQKGAEEEKERELASCGLTEASYSSSSSYTLPVLPTPRPFRVHVAKPTKPEKLKAGQAVETEIELNEEDASKLHWQFLFEALRVVFEEKHPRSIFIFQQSCGSGGMWQWLQPNPELVQPLSSSSLELAASLSNNSSEEMNSDVSNQVASTETRESKFKPVSSSSELSKTSSVYEQKFSVQNWPLYVIFTAQPETSAIGSGWTVFFDVFQHLAFPSPRCFSLGYSRGPSESTSDEFDSSASKGSELGDERESLQSASKDSATTLVSNASTDGQIVYERTPVDTISQAAPIESGAQVESGATQVELGAAQVESGAAQIESGSCRINILPSLQFFKHFSDQYYKGDDLVVRVNFKMTDNERGRMNMKPFGVVGYACGTKSNILNDDFRSLLR